MSGKLLSHRRNLFFYFLSAYLLAMFFWWWFMMMQQSKELYREKEQVLYYLYEHGESEEVLKEHETLIQERERKKWMIIGEGTTFLVLMLLGMYRLKSTIQKELNLAGMESNFLLSITHELKSPLASARLNLQTLSSRNLSQEQQNLLIRNTESDVTRLNNLVEKILLASRIGHQNMGVEKEELNYSELVEECVEAIIKRNPTAIVNSDIDDQIWVNGDEVMLKSLVLNLLENAVKYAPRHTPIELGLDKKGDKAVLSVGDEGDMIPEREKIKIFDRFYRMGSEETRTSIGVGLGLFIVKQVALMHHGNVRITEKNQKGKTFKVEIPYIGAV